MSRCNTVAIYGVGLIGGSIGKAVLACGLAKQVVGIGRDLDRLRTAQECRAITYGSTDVAACAEADLVVLCAPVSKVPEQCAQVLKHCAASALLTDVGSTKESLVAAIESLGTTNFVGSHPLAGSDRTGVENARADLFRNRVVVVTPTERTDGTALARTQEFWQDLGARVITMSPAVHDKSLAVTSHMPHLLASVLAMQTPPEFRDVVGPAWRELTRIAGADADLWSQIFNENKSNVVRAVADVRRRLQQYEDAIQEGDVARVIQLWNEGKQHRDALGN